MYLIKFNIQNIALNGKSDFTFRVPVDSNLLCGTYKLELAATDTAKKKIASDVIEYTVSPAYGDFMPVILWGHYEDFKAIREAGFTHQMVHLFPRTGNFKPEDTAKWIQHLDDNR